MTTKRLFKWLQVFVNKVQKIGNIEFYDEVEIPMQYKYVRATYKDYMLMLKYQNGFIFYANILFHLLNCLYKHHVNNHWLKTLADSVYKLS